MFNLYSKHIMRNAGLDELQAGIKIGGRNISNLRYMDDTTLIVELNRHLTLSTKVHRVKIMVFPVVTFGCESWTVKKAEHQRIDAFELWCWRRLLRVLWMVRRSNQSILKEIDLEYSLEGLMPKLKLLYFGHLMQQLTH